MEPSLVSKKSADFESVLAICDVAYAVARFSGPYVVKALAMVSQDVGQASAAAWPTLKVEFLPGCIYICGGISEEHLRSTERLCLQQGDLEAAPHMKAQRCSPAAAVLEGQIYMCGGSDGEAALSSCERFDPGSGCWEEVPSMLTAREGAGAGVINGQLYVCGGWQRDGPLVEAESFNPATLRWQSLPRLLSPRAWSATAPIDNKLYMCGGQNRIDPLSSATCLDTACLASSELAPRAWTFIPPMTEARCAAAAAVLQKRLYVCGGWDMQRRDLQTVECYVPADSIWEVATPMSVCRFGAAATVGGCGRLHVFGGCDDSGMALNSIEQLDENMSRWVMLDPLQQQRSGATAVAAWA